MNTEKIRERLGDAEHHLSNNRIADVCIAIREAIAELDKAQQPGRVLTDEEIDHIADTTPPPSRAKSYAEYCAEEAGFVRGLRYARDNGYLASAAGLTVDEVMEAIEDDIGSEGMMRLFRARLTDALEAKTRTA